MPHAYTEDQLVEQPTIGLFAELGWWIVSAMEVVLMPPSAQPSSEGRGSVFSGPEASDDLALKGWTSGMLSRVPPRCG